jgi:retron-type reverse transcriptase
MNGISCNSKIKKIFGSNLLSNILSNDNLDEAFKHICHTRIKDKPNSDVWHLRHNWLMHRKDIRDNLMRNTYNLSPLTLYRGNDNKYYGRWEAKDAVILKAIAIKLSPVFSQTIGSTCSHLSGNGGLKGATQKAAANINDYKYVIKSDVANFYASMNHHILLNHCSNIVHDKRLLRILFQYMNRLEIFNGEYKLVTQAISKGCPLSPLRGALILKSLDKIVGPKNFYIRYMDDWVIYTKTRGDLRRLVKKMHAVMAKLQFKLALDKTYIGKISNGFEFLGYCFNQYGLIGLASKTIKNFLEKWTKLYEQRAPEERLRQYVTRWTALSLRRLN